MKNLLIPTLFIVPLFILQSCGPSREELERSRQALIDSVARATENKLALKALEEKEKQERIRKQKEEKARRNKDVARLREKLLRTETEIAVQYQKLEDIKAPKFLRTITEKEEQIRNQLLYIQALQSAAERLRNMIQLIDSGESYSLDDIDWNKMR